MSDGEGTTGYYKQITFHCSDTETYITRIMFSLDDENRNMKIIFRDIDLGEDRVNFVDPIKLRDFLNYAFPKENI